MGTISGSYTVDNQTGYLDQSPTDANSTDPLWWGQFDGAEEFSALLLGIEVDQGDIVDVATLTLPVTGSDGVVDGDTWLGKITALAVDNATDPTIDLSTAARTTAVAFTDGDFYRPGFDMDVDITDVLQEIVDRPGWVAGGGIVLIFEDNGSNTETDILVDYPSELDVTWETSGTPTHTGTVTGSWTYTAAASGHTTHTGATTGTFRWAGAAAGHATHTGAVAGGITWSGVAVGHAPALPPNTGAVAGTFGWAGAAAGHATHTGAVAGGITWSGVAVGFAPGVDAHTGVVAGTYTWSGVAAGHTDHAGSVVGTFGWAGAAAGHATHTGAVAGGITWSGVAVGHAPAGPGRELTLTAGPTAIGYTAGPSAGGGYQPGPTAIGYTAGPTDQ